MKLLIAFFHLISKLISFCFQHWRKQNRMLRQAAESRLRLCEQLESAAAESERAKIILRKEIEVERQRHAT